MHDITPKSFSDNNDISPEEYALWLQAVQNNDTGSVPEDILNEVERKKAILDRVGQGMYKAAFYALCGTSIDDIETWTGQDQLSIQRALKSAEQKIQKNNPSSVISSKSTASHSNDSETPWYKDALCAQTDPEIFFPERGESSREAKKICSRCDVVKQCLREALENGYTVGVWGNTTANQRVRMLRNIAQDADDNDDNLPSGVEGEV